MRMQLKTLVVLSLPLWGTWGCAAVQPRPNVAQCNLQSTSLNPQQNGLGVLTRVEFVAPSNVGAEFRQTQCCGRLVPNTVHTMCTAARSGGTPFTLPPGGSQTVARSLVLPWTNISQVQTIASGYNPIFVALQCTVSVIISGVPRTCSYSDDPAFTPASLPPTLIQSTQPPCCALLDVPGVELARAPAPEHWWLAPASAMPGAPPVPDAAGIARLDATWW